jgi:hypothetical protein
MGIFIAVAGGTVGRFRTAFVDRGPTRGMNFEIRHLILAVHVAMGFAFFGLATLYILSDNVLGGALRAVFGLLLVGAGFYLYRMRARQDRMVGQ